MRRSRKWAFAGLAFALLGGAVGLDEVLWRGAHAAAVASVVSDAVLDPGSIFAERSPGLRGSGPLLQTKPDRVAAAALPMGPEERVLSGVRDRPDDLFPAGGPPLALNDAPPSLTFGDQPAGPPGGGSPPPGGPGTPGPLTPPGLEGGPPGGGPPGGGPPGGGPPGGPPLTAVPEPADWMLMIMAMFGAGAALRRKRAADRRATSDASARANA